MKSSILAISMLLSMTIAAAAAPRPIAIGSEGASPPWNQIGDDGKLAGFDIDVGKDLCRRANLDCRFVAQDWDGIIPALTVGKFDAIMCGMAITEKRKKSIAFSRPYAGGFNQIVLRKEIKVPALDTTAKLDLTEIDASKQKTMDILKQALSGRTLGVLRSSNSEVVLKSLVGSDATIRSYDSQDNLQLDLAAGRIDGGLADYFTWKTFLDGPNGKEAAFFGPELSGGPWGPGVGIGLRQSDADLVAVFDKAIGEAQADGTLSRLSLQWFGLDVSPQP
ncbi:transporter substrate-binding domain-containing protein [Rhizobium sp. BK376]|uniref:transporter substrate-binding domain-containing protein n=1 Tax=Rhizobium sp. BK376 TaxID=2512149 RepID=UPI00104C9B36|nr:transporter substrate-binding domain-containing protein [Rhizobium sp. BK376]TCR74073.1 amino acid ABC transporter substrate-binding protein (PAAT family) [Rhizobium sp. BK376]